jgi:hypothetical protein
VEAVKNKLKKVKNRAVKTKLPLWDNPLWLILIMMCILGEWIYRRRAGLW